MQTVEVEIQSQTLYDAFIAEAEQSLRREDKLETLTTANAILAADPSIQANLVAIMFYQEIQYSHHKRSYATSYAIYDLLNHLFRRKLPYILTDIQSILKNIIMQFTQPTNLCSLYAAFRSLSGSLQDPEMLTACRPELEQILAHFRNQPQYAYTVKCVKLLEHILNGQQTPANPVRPDDWSTPLIASLDELDEVTRDSWLTVLRHCATANGSIPNHKWQAALPALLEQPGIETFLQLATQWIGSLAQTKGGRLDTDNVLILKGLAWCCAGQTNATITTVLADAAIEGYRKVPGIGPRAAAVASACIYALKNISDLHSAAQIERVRLNVKQPTYLKGIEQALTEVAQRTGITREDLVELTVPTFGIQDGRIRHTVGAEYAELTLVGQSVNLQWYNADGKPRKAPSAEVKRTYKAELKDVKRLYDDITHMLMAQRDRLETLPLQERQWTFTDWRERYLKHPLIAHLSKRLIWRFTFADRCTIEERFLKVRGDLRTYKIHLGSGNILMEPNDQYLCIVPDQSYQNKEENVFLPFEGDNIFSIILSKAFLLADDTRINDPTITRQIGLYKQQE